MDQVYIITDENNRVVAGKHQFTDAAVLAASMACLSADDVENLDAEAVREVTGYRIDLIYVD